MPSETMTADFGTDDALRRIRGEYLEMPGLRLTAAQAKRLWNLDQEQCEVLLSALVDAHFLRHTPDGGFIRYDSGSPARSSSQFHRTRLCRRAWVSSGRPEAS